MAHGYVWAVWVINLLTSSRGCISTTSYLTRPPVSGGLGSHHLQRAHNMVHYFMINPPVVHKKHQTSYNAGCIASCCM